MVSNSDSRYVVMVFSRYYRTNLDKVHMWSERHEILEAKSRRTATKIPLMKLYPIVSTIKAPLIIVR